LKSKFIHTYSVRITISNYYSC